MAEQKFYNIEGISHFQPLDFFLPLSENNFKRRHHTKPCSGGGILTGSKTSDFKGLDRRKKAFPSTPVVAVKQPAQNICGSPSWLIAPVCEQYSDLPLEIRLGPINLDLFNIYTTN